MMRIHFPQPMLVHALGFRNRKFGIYNETVQMKLLIRVNLPIEGLAGALLEPQDHGDGVSLILWRDVARKPFLLCQHPLHVFHGNCNNYGNVTIVGTKRRLLANSEREVAAQNLPPQTSPYGVCMPEPSARKLSGYDKFGSVSYSIRFPTPISQ